MESLSFVQKLLKMLLPASTFEDMRRESQQWKMLCECGHSDSVWDMGGIRYKATGEKRTLHRCRGCNQHKMVTIKRV